VSAQPKIQRIKVRGSCRPLDWAFMFYALSNKSVVHLLSDSAEKMRCALSRMLACVVGEEARLPRVLVNH